MSSNTSQAKALSILHRAKVAVYAAWSLIVTCRPCDAPRTVPLATLLPGWRGRAARVWGPGSYG